MSSFETLFAAFYALLTTFSLKLLLLILISYSAKELFLNLALGKAYPVLWNASLFFGVAGFVSYSLMGDYSRFKRNLTKSFSNLITQAEMKNCSFSKAAIYQCNFQHSDLSFGDFKKSNVRRSYFEYSNLDFVEWRYAKFEGCFFSIDQSLVLLCSTLIGSSQNYRSKSLSRMNLTGVDLSGADLTSADLSSTILDKANLEGALISNAKLLQARIKDTCMNGCDLKGSDISLSAFENVDLREANLSEVKAIGTKFLKGTDLSGACIANWSINGNSKFKEVKCSHIYFDYLYDGSKTEYSERVPEGERSFLKAGEFESIIARFYRIVAVVFQYALSSVGEIDQNTENSDGGIVDEPERLKNLERAVQENSLDQEDKQEILGFLRGQRELLREVNNVWLGKSTSSENILNYVINYMPNNKGDQKIGRTSSHNAVNVGSNSGSIQAVSSGGDSRAVQQLPSSSEEISREAVITLLTQFCEIIKQAELPSEISESAETYAKLAKEEAEKTAPNKKIIAGNLKIVSDLVKDMVSVTGDTQTLIEKLKGPVIKIASWLGIAAAHIL